ncbi:MAG: hypothetical protein HQM02_11785 [Magnetococcales bacterium]|nr:hypothetical protein [Magnetococcales bacterium]
MTLWSRCKIGVLVLLSILAVCGAQPLRAAQAHISDLEMDAAQSILNDPALLQRVLALAQDPNVQAILNDEKLMEAVRGGKVDLLATHPAIKQLMGHPVVQEIKSKQQR